MLPNVLFFNVLLISESDQKRKGLKMGHPFFYIVKNSAHRVKKTLINNHLSVFAQRDVCGGSFMCNIYIRVYLFRRTK